MHRDFPLLTTSLFSLRYLLDKLCTCTFIHTSQLIIPLPPFLARYNLPTFPLGCRLPFMVINFLVLKSILFNSSFVQSNTPATYLIIPTAHAFIPAITFPPFSCDLSNFFALLMYTLFTFSFISLSMMEPNYNTPRYLYLSRLTSLTLFLPGNSIPSV